MKVIFSFPAKIAGALVLLLVLFIIEISFYAKLDQVELSLGAIALLLACIVFLAIQGLFSIGISNEAIAVWDYVATLTGGAAALIFVCGGLSYMSDSYMSDMLPLVEDRLDDTIGLFGDFQTDYCVVTPTRPVPGSAVPPAGDAINATTVTKDDPEIAFMCERAKEIKESLELLDRPANAMQVSELYQLSIETLPHHLQFLGDKKLSFKETPQSIFRQGSSLISRINSMLSRGQRFVKSGELLAVFQGLTKGPNQFIWGLMLWNALSLKCGIILAKRR